MTFWQGRKSHAPVLVRGLYIRCIASEAGLLNLEAKVKLLDLCAQHGHMASEFFRHALGEGNPSFNLMPLWRPFGGLFMHLTLKKDTKCSLWRL